MRPPTVATARRAIWWSLLLGAAAMLQYPGGHPFDRAATRYSLTRNFLSDLGMTAAINGQSNRLGAGLFATCMVVLVGGTAIILVALVKQYSDTLPARRYARGAGVAGALASASFVAVAFTPENLVMGIHVQATLFAFRLLPVSSALLALAAIAANGVPLRSVRVLVVLSAALLAYLALLTWGPSLSSLAGLETYVIAQKVVAVMVVGALLLLSSDERFVAPTTGSAEARAGLDRATQPPEAQADRAV